MHVHRYSLVLDLLFFFLSGSPPSSFCLIAIGETEQYVSVLIVSSYLLSPLSSNPPVVLSFVKNAPLVAYGCLYSMDIYDSSLPILQLQP